ncbi:MAG: PIN domain-containing protein [Nitrospira defluvii]|nr:PIN domain-containing protein [Nitrospira defluvii]
MKFWDASALIPLCLDELQTASLRKLAEEDEAIVAWWATPVECYSAFARLRREDFLTTMEEEQARTVLTALAAEWTEIEPSRVVREQAGRALLLHPLRAADALQLAAALVWSRGQTAGHHFVCLDQRLREAARREGFTLLPPAP